MTIDETFGIISATLTKIDGGLAPSGPLAGDGYFLSLKLSSDDWDQYDSVYVGLDPSEGTGLVRIDEDPDHQVTMKLAIEEGEQFAQKFLVVAYGGNTSVTKKYSFVLSLD